MMNTSMQQKLTEKHKEIIKNRDALAKSLKSFENETYMNICRLTADELHNKIKSKELTVSAVLNAFQMRCKSVENYNYLAEYILEANEWAANLDKDTNPRIDNPLYGIPISIKDMVRVKGKDASCGLVKFCGNPSKEDSVLVEVLKHLNAIPFITTSMFMDYDASNKIYGEQTNPFFKNRLAGGSSGGEGIILALDGSALGVGTDLAGSIRMPSAFNGICGLKPTYRRISDAKNDGSKEICWPNLHVVIGPMGRCVTDLKNFMLAILCPLHFQLDPFVVPLPFNVDMYEGTHKPLLKIGYYDCFDDAKMLKCVPSVKRGVMVAVNALKKRGHEVIPFKVPQPYKAYTLAHTDLLFDEGKMFLKLLKNEPLKDSDKTLVKLLDCPRFFKQTANYFVKNMEDDKLKPLMASILGLNSSKDVANHMREVALYREEFLSNMAEIDAIVCPNFTEPIPLKNDFDDSRNISECYAILYNLLDLPAGTLSVSRVTEKDNYEAKRLADRFEKENNKLDAHVHKNQTDIDLPLSVQVVSKPFREEMVLRVMKVIEEEVDFKRS